MSISWHQNSLCPLNFEFKRLRVEPYGLKVSKIKWADPGIFLRHARLCLQFSTDCSAEAFLLYIICHFVRLYHYSCLVFKSLFPDATHFTRINLTDQII
jgi:hypothetical protein